MVKLRQHCLVVEIKTMRIWEKERYIKTRFSGDMLSVFNLTFIYPAAYFTM